MNNCLCIITARGGSKRIPRKNIKDFLGAPIIKYSIDAAIGASCFDEVMVSTDDKEIAEISLSLGAKIPFMRTAATSNDYATTTDVIMEVLNKYRLLGNEFNYACCIYPTAPFITTEKLENAFNKLIESGADSIVPVVRYGFPIQRSFKIQDGLVKLNWPEFFNSRSQDLPPVYHDCGQFYFFRTETVFKYKRLISDFTIPIEMSELEVQDIDNEEDWKIAEIKHALMLKNLKKE